MSDRIPYDSKLAVLVRDHDLDVPGVIEVACAYCADVGQIMWTGTSIYSDRFQFDHIRPLTRGGERGPDNLVVACGVCNRSKGARTIIEWAEFLETGASNIERVDQITGRLEAVWPC